MTKLINWFKMRSEKRRVRPGMIVTSDSYGGLYVVHRADPVVDSTKYHGGYMYCHLQELVPPGRLKEMGAACSYGLHVVRGGLR